ncbi:MAG: histidine phosphatase family protein [Acidimicrobiales bacterium]|nr:histidine phosphatase family protein [Acidimicrobiales bacterium]
MSAEYKETKLTLIRHGESQCNVDGIIGGESGCTGLSRLGHEHAKALGERALKTGEFDEVEVFISSTLPRAIETLDHLIDALVERSKIRGADFDPTIEKVSDLVEMQPGQADGMTWGEFLEKYGAHDFRQDPHKPIAPGGESWASFMQRASDALEKVASEHAGKSIAIACHGGVIQASMVNFLGLDNYGARAGLRPDYTSLTKWAGGPGEWRLVRYNDISHLIGLDLNSSK